MVLDNLQEKLQELYGGCAGTIHNYKGRKLYCCGDGIMSSNYRVIWDGQEIAGLVPSSGEVCKCRVAEYIKGRDRYFREKLSLPEEVKEPKGKQPERIKKYSGKNLYLWGPAGCGKTATAYFMVEGKDKQIKVYNSIEMRDYMRSLSLDGGGMEGFEMPEILVWDDADRCGESEYFKNAVFHLLNRIGGKTKFIIISNFPPETFVKRLGILPGEADSLLRRIHTRMEVMEV